VFRAIGWMAAVVLALLLALVAWVAVDAHFKAEAPDIGGIARSQAVVTADHEAATAMDAGLKAVATGGGGAVVQGPTAVADYCETSRASGFMAGWLPADCSRQEFEYFFSDAPITQTTTAWIAALRTAGWSAYQVSEGQSPLYFPGGVGGYTPGSAVTIRVSWLDGARGTSVLAGNMPYVAPGSVVAWIQHSSVPRGTATSGAYARYKYAAVVMLNANYYNGDTGDVFDTPSPVRATNVCISGSGTCN